MRWKGTFLIILFTLFTKANFFAGNSLGVGIVAGEPTGISVKYFFNGNSAVDLVLAWSFERKSSFRVHSDYLYHFSGVFDIPQGKLLLYLGGGAYINISEELTIGARIPIGIAYLFSFPLEVFLEIAPVLHLLPSTTLGANAGIGIRYYFNFSEKGSRSKK